MVECGGMVNPTYYIDELEMSLKHFVNIDEVQGVNDGRRSCSRQQTIRCRVAEYNTTLNSNALTEVCNACFPRKHASGMKRLGLQNDLCDGPGATYDIQFGAYDGQRLSAIRR
jgi:hypothetical protein